MLSDDWPRYHERKHAEHERLEAEKMRMEVYKEREVLDLKEKFIATMSHEFRTPLSVILSATSSLETYHDRLTPERRSEHLQNIANQAHYATNLLDDVLKSAAPIRENWNSAIAA